jgi:vesicular inhibitory amino acid transporter
MPTVWRPAEEGAASEDEFPPILVREVEQDGKIVLTVEGQSTLPQTIFNSINVLIGVGLLSLPLGLRYAGWICGMVFLFLSAIVTAYTARLLARCMDLDPSLITFSDVAYISFGTRARVASSILFTLELMAANVALVVLFADSLDLLFPDLMSIVQWKLTCVVVLIPLNFMPLRLLSFTSVIGIFSCICSKSLPRTRFQLDCEPPLNSTLTVVVIVLIDGFIKQHSPGSLLEPAATYLFPAKWSTLPLSFGLLLSPWGGHSVFPNVGSMEEAIACMSSLFLCLQLTDVAFRYTVT